MNYTYDNLGRLTAAVNSVNSLSYNYDALNRVVQAMQDGKTVSYTYDAMGNRTRLTYPDNSYVTYTYNSLNRLDQIQNAAEETIADFTYDELGRRTRLDLLNGTRTEYQYDTLHRLTSLSSKKTSTEAIITNFNYTFDRMGNRLSMTSDSEVHSYQYDAVYQLTGVDYPVPFIDMNYNYDSVANRTSTVNGGTVNYTTNTLNQYTAAGATVFTYDANGNMTGSVAPAPTPADPPYLGGTYSFQYDYENRLVQAAAPSNTASYTYGPFGRRTAKTVSSETVKYIYDGDQVIAEYNGSGTLLRKFIYGTGIDEPLVMETGGTQYYYHFDALGSVTALTDSDGALVETYRYDVYGKPCIMDASDPFAIECCFSACSTTVGNPYLFTGRRFDSESGLYYYRARHYSPELGRFLQADPIEYFDSMNLYQYVSNNPVNFVDPMGLVAVIDDAAIIALAGLIAISICILTDCTEPISDAIEDASDAISEMCSDEDDPCDEIIREIYNTMNVLQSRIDDMLRDRCNLFHFAYSIPNPNLPNGCYGTWLGHQVQARGWQQRLRNLISRANRIGCPIPPGA